MLVGVILRRLFGNDTPDKPPTASEELQALVRCAMPDADAATASIVGALAGLLATVAHADRSYTEAERAHVREVLGRTHGVTAEAQSAIMALLDARMADLAHESLQTYTRVLYEGLSREARLEVFEVLMDLAAADDVLDVHETHLLRRIARGLGLSDDEYLASQSRHRERLGILRKEP